LSLPEKNLKAFINGSVMELPEGTTIAGLLKILEMDSVLVAVEQNLDIVPKRIFSERTISSGDRIEIVHFVGGG
jgi:sulfur carrier protein